MPPPLVPVQFAVLKDLRNALRGIAAASGFYHTVQSTEVHLDPTVPVERIFEVQAGSMMIVLEVLPTRFEYTPARQLRLVMPVTIHAAAITGDRDSDRLEEFCKMAADIERAIAADVTRGGRAVDTRILTSRMESNTDELQVVAILPMEIIVHRTYGEPNA